MNARGWGWYLLLRSVLALARDCFACAFVQLISLEKKKS